MVRVMIERICHPGKESEFRELLMELRMVAMHQRGYISSETLRELIAPSLFIVISTWASLEHWKAWQASRQRLLIEEKIDSLTTSQRRVRIFAMDYET